MQNLEWSHSISLSGGGVGVDAHFDDSVEKNKKITNNLTRSRTCYREIQAQIQAYEVQRDGRTHRVFARTHEDDTKHARIGDRRTREHGLGGRRAIGLAGSSKRD